MIKNLSVSNTQPVQCLDAQVTVGPECVLEMSAGKQTLGASEHVWLYSVLAPIHIPATT